MKAKKENINSSSPRRDMGELEYMERRRDLENEISAVSNPNTFRLDMLRSHSINLSFLNSGCIVSVGCFSATFNDPDSALKAISDYVKDPVGKSAEWRDISNNVIKREF